MEIRIFKPSTLELPEHGTRDLAGVDMPDNPRLRAAFDAVADRADWRAPINVLVMVPADVLAEFRALISEAVEFYTATEPTFHAWDRHGDQVEVRVGAVGYRNGPAGA